VTERYAQKGFLQVNTVHVPWTQKEHERLLGHYLVVEPRWTVLAMTWKASSAA
jgi:hypothetical protein